MQPLSSTPTPRNAFPNDPPVDATLAKSLKLSADEFAAIEARLGRLPSYAELGVLSVMWSEHCSYKSSRVHLARLPTQGPRVIQGPGENAGVVDIGDGMAAVFKMESHNHPSYIEPYQGAATGVGGILRDVFTMGARPIANLNSLRFGRPDHPRTAELLRGVVAGIGGYGNAIGVPTVGGEVSFDAAFDGNILVNAFTCGVVRADKIFYGRASGVGNNVIYVGARTGRDGIHGATMASDEFSSGGPSQRPTVQVGDPFMEKLLLEACLEIFAADVLVGVQDMGAAGLTSSSVEMAGRSGSGLLLDLDKIPRRTQGLLPYEMLLSESQERMLMVAKPGREEEVFAICRKWELDCAIIGKVTDSGRWVVTATPGYDPYTSDEPPQGEPIIVCDLPVDFLTDEAPKYDRPTAPVVRASSAAPLPNVEDYKAELLSLLGAPNVGSRQWIYRQFDGIVRGGTASRPGGDAAVVRVPCEQEGGALIDKWLAFSVDCNSRFCELDPYEGAKMAVAEVCRNVSAVGATPIGLTDCLNFGSPERPEIMWQFSRAIDGLRDACLALEVPIVSGNVSLYNETEGRAILPTPTLGAVGLLPESPALVGAAFPEEGLDVFVLGATLGGALGGSAWLHHRTGRVEGELPRIDLAFEARLQSLVRKLIGAKLLRSVHDISEGGLAVALAECSTLGVGGPLGCEVLLASEEPLTSMLFGENPSRFIVSLESAHVARISELALEAAIPFLRLGKTGGEALILRQPDGLTLTLSTADLLAAREGCLGGIVGA